VRLLPPGARRILDVGSGAGVPGVPLKIVLADAALTLLEARAKRVSFLAAVVRELGLLQCEVLNARLDAIRGDRAGHYDAVVMRCAGDPTTLYEAALPGRRQDHDSSQRRRWPRLGGPANPADRPGSPGQRYDRSRRPEVRDVPDDLSRPARGRVAREGRPRQRAVGPSVGALGHRPRRRRD